MMGMNNQPLSTSMTCLSRFKNIYRCTLRDRDMDPGTLPNFGHEFEETTMDGSLYYCV